MIINRVVGTMRQEEAVECTRIWRVQVMASPLLDGFYEALVLCYSTLLQHGHALSPMGLWPKE